MNHLISLILSSLISFTAVSQKKLTEGAALLFSNVKTMLTTAEKNEIFAKSGLGISGDQKQFVLTGYALFADHPFDAYILPTDINGDGKEDLFLIFGNNYISGETGSNILLFIKDKTGIYQSNFGFSGTTPLIIASKNFGYPDLLIGGPGLEYPVWRWNGKEYIFFKKINEQSLAKMKAKKLDELSRLYTRNITLIHQ